MGMSTCIHASTHPRIAHPILRFPYHGINDVHHGPQAIMAWHLQRRSLGNLQHSTGQDRAGQSHTQQMNTGIRSGVSPGG